MIAKFKAATLGLVIGLAAYSLFNVYLVITGPDSVSFARFLMEFDLGLTIFVTASSLIWGSLLVSVKDHRRIKSVLAGLVLPAVIFSIRFPKAYGELTFLDLPLLGIVIVASAPFSLSGSLLLEKLTRSLMPAMPK
jgi:hypothetical protein